MKKTYLHYSLFLVTLILSNVALCGNCYATSKQDILVLAQKLLSDSLVPTYFQGAKISEKMSHKPSDKEKWESYDILTQGKRDSLSRIALFQRAPDTYDFRIILDNLNNNSGGESVTDWDKMVPKWDAFVARYWPNTHRISDWQNEIWRRSGSGTFTIQYVFVKQNLELFKVSLNIRLSDGKIGGISTRDTRFLFRDKKIPPPPTNEQIFKAVRKALREKKKGFSEAKITKSEIRRSIFAVPDGRKFIVDSGNLWITDVEGKTYIITFDYGEKSQLAEVSYITTQKELDNFRQKPLTQVDDKQPSWSADGKQLYFVTSRRASDQPWWTPIAFQYAIAVNQVGTDNLQYISPVKTKLGDYGLYQSPQISPDSRHLAAGLGSDEAYLFILNLTKGLLHIPQRDPAFLVRQQKEFGLPDAFLTMTQSMFRDDGNKYPWISKGFQWLANGDFIYLGWLNGGGEQIFLARKTSDDQGQVWDVWPVHQKQGEETLLCLSSDEKVLSWAHQEPEWKKKKEDKDASDKPYPWQFITANFDVSKPGVSNLIEIDLPDKPASISWDSQRERWLIVTEKNELLWIQKTDGKLTVTKVLLPLTWNDNKLRPTSAAVSPDGNHIALAAELEKPVTYSKTECVVRSMIFDWDGKSTFVKPFYDPSINGISRYHFPATNSTWAKVEGNLKGLGLQDIIDPDFVMPADNPPKS